MKKDLDQDLLELEPRSRSGAGVAGTIALAAVIGLGVGLLAAPQAGERTRKQLRKRIASLGEDLGDGLEQFEERSRPARRKLAQRAERLREQGEQAWEELEERLDRLESRDEPEGGGLMGLVTFAAGIAATYFLTSDQAAPTRAKVREAATDFSRRATDRWDRFQDRRHANGGASEGAAKPESPSGKSGEL